MASAPGLRPERLATLIQRQLALTGLDLTGRVVLTEAATGAYSVTPILAAAAGADVLAVTRSTRFGTVDDVVAATSEIARRLDVERRITIHESITRDLVSAADVITNSGHVRPIDARVVEWMQSTAVVPLMFEAWEVDLGRDDVDLDALRARGIRFAGTNERHPHVDVFSYLGAMAVKLLADAAIPAYRSRVLVLCDNPFAPYLEQGLDRAGAAVTVRAGLDLDDLVPDLDVVLVALKPRGEPVLAEADVAEIARRSPGVVIAQFWGDVPRSWCDDAGVACAPAEAPGAGHMGVLPSAIGPEPIVRLQAGGLKVAEVLLRAETDRTTADLEYLDEL